MKQIILLSAAVVTLCAFGSKQTKAQHTLSFDIAAVRNTHKQLNGFNVSSFYHFTEHITGGIEINRFFPVNKKLGEEAGKLSAWDFDLNFHYQVSLNHHWIFYPVTGISHTSEKETITEEGGEAFADHFWSYNTGAGILWHKGKWAPHAEYLFTWGKWKQQFFLAGFSYEFETVHKKHVAKK